MLRTLIHALYASFHLIPLCSLLCCFHNAQAQTVESGDSSAIRNLIRGASIRFIENKGQFPDSVRFIAPINEGYVLFMRDRIVLQLTEGFENAIEPNSLLSSPRSFLSELHIGDEDRSQERKSRIVTKILTRLDSKAWGPPIAQGLRMEKINYFFGGYLNCETGLEVPTWDTLLYNNAQEGINVNIFRSNSTLSYSLTILDSASENQSAKCMDLDQQFRTLCSATNTPPPVEMQPSSKTNKRILYSTLLGGSKTDGIGCILRARENVYYLIGSTKSLDFPIAGSAYCDTYRADTSLRFANMIFVTCIDILNNQLIFSTYFGGSDVNGMNAASVDVDGNIVFAGSTWSDDLPTTVNAFQKTYRGEGDGYVAAIDSTGSKLVFCSYLGGTDVENLRDMKIDREGNIVLTGITMSRNFPTTPGVVQRNYGGGEDDIFVAKLSSDASRLIFSTYFGGNGYDEGRSVRLTDSGDILVAGYTNSDNFPVTRDALYSNRAAFDEGCVFILSPDGSRIVYSTYMGWNAYENAHDAYLDSDGVMTVFGITTSDDLPVTENAFQRQRGEYPDYNPYSFDFFILRYHVASAKILACTYLGGTGNDRYPQVLFPIPDGRYLVGGLGNSHDSPATDSIATTTSGIYSPQLTILSSDLIEVDFSLRFGGSDITDLRCAFVDHKHLYISGFTYWQDYPVTPSAYQTERKGETDGFFMILDLSDILTTVDTSPMPLSMNTLYPNYPNPVQSGSTIPYSLGRAGHVRLSIHDMLGRTLLTLANEYKAAGVHREHIAAGTLPPGAYIIRLLTEEGQQSRLMQVIGE